ncbi:MAG: phosphodiester glycosidase family protein [Candidatus Sericytochromatia bacterium]
MQTAAVGRCLSGLALLVGLLGGCSRELSFPLDPTAKFATKLAPARNQAPLEKALAIRLKQPGDYRQIQTLQIASGVLYQQFELKTGQGRGDPRYTLRTLLLAPRAFGRLKVLFSDRPHHPLYAQTVLARPGIQVLLNGSFFGRVPAGDVIGLRCSEHGRDCAPGIYDQAEKLSGKDLDQRYTLMIDQRGRAGLFRGGLGSSSRQQYRLAMGGGLLLFDRDQAAGLYGAVGTGPYERLYSSPRYNHADLVARGQGGFPGRSAPRTAVGILGDGSLLLVNLGEGKYRFSGGASPARMAVLMKQLGAVRALLFDGGGAPQMAIKNRRGELMIRSYPEMTRSSNYLYNYAFVTLLG